MSIESIERLTQRHAADRDALATAVMQLEAEITAAKKARVPQIRKLADRAKESHEAVRLAVDDERGLFVRPRSRIFHGIRVGLEKGKGKLKYDDVKALVKQIRKLFPERATLLVKTTEKPIIKSVLALSAADLKRLGCEIVGAGDQVIVRSTESEIDKLVDALINGNTEPEDTEEEA